jgi:hypothetical protein
VAPNDGYALVTVAFGPAAGSDAAEVRLDVEVAQNHVAGHPETTPIRLRPSARERRLLTGPIDRPAGVSTLGRVRFGEREGPLRGCTR